ncbi:SELENOF [Bugula neritina]|uniref:Selenoprotein F n=1 Tax=Bugula neritina TaxID=10212 RepID=A0A7J7IV20_BUGNE|nr:SELENOF [Bugula neritina]KAF6038006.1 SELENOF [Bugula neritina]
MLQLPAFITDKAKLAKFPGLKVTYRRGSDPFIHLQNESKTTVETLAIDKWNTDTVEEFFSEHLESR